jgi:hypothetical protein
MSRSSAASGRSTSPGGADSSITRENVGGSDTGGDSLLLGPQIREGLAGLLDVVLCPDEITRFIPCGTDSPRTDHVSEPGEVGLKVFDDEAGFVIHGSPSPVEELFVLTGVIGVAEKLL